jgi:hypothetical protein
MQTIPFLGSVCFPPSHGVRELLENVLDQALLITNDCGEVLFATRQTRIILQTLFVEPPDKEILNEIRTWLIKGDRNEPFVVRHPDKGEIRIHSFLFSDPVACHFCGLKIDLSIGAPKRC